jgi:hypothetical protein
MASKAEYLNMMKRMDNESVMRPDEIESTTADLMQDPALKDLMMPPMPMSKFSDMLRKADPLATGREGENVLKGAMGAGMTGNMIDEMANKPTATSDASLVLSTMKKFDPRSVVREGEMLDIQSASPMIQRLGSLYNKVLSGEKLTDDVRNQLGKMLDPKSVVREGEMGSMREDMLADLSMADREAVEGLTTMGVSLTDAIKAVMGVSESPASMTEGALGSLPKENRVRREEEPDPMRGDTTQSLDMQDSINT